MSTRWWYHKIKYVVRTVRLYVKMLSHVVVLCEFNPNAFSGHFLLHQRYNDRWLHPRQKKVQFAAAVSLYFFRVTCSNAITPRTKSENEVNIHFVVWIKIQFSIPKLFHKYQTLNELVDKIFTGRIDDMK